ncbi:hypothetical protein [Bradyrhizobium japonicum]|uniref:hypothetical protein n=1 Tax=Bradyrhizobium japonicum TaxID=375 RepID=UPI00068A95A8|nr:hypothetical protein [Bradyrhizobium japonicum]MCD9111059.1 hypothetical protein [Bradyrhizobium japonicum]MCD9256562.1 hypothetical protein [Bradyrhizobium japonicum SEMIA 5079]MCD9823937.1 hypothetical protein [Bradyrhizobium japonicum]MCD9896232.1 hypothetical protein [Bradyrhizobium japonicum]MCD9911551.1 hypothetical protein [Bradyrhizobium japonicum]
MLSATAQREQDILALWDRAAGRAQRQRDDALFAAAGAAPTDSIGTGNAALLALRTRLFGAPWRLRAACPTCHTDCEFMADSAVLADGLAPPADAVPQRITNGGRELALRLPTLSDLASLAATCDSASAANLLLARCLGEAPPAAQDILHRVEAELERCDPGAVLSFALDCPDCGHAWQAMIDIAPALWTEVQAAAEHTLLEVDALAREYGWSEAEVLALPHTRRAAYLQLAGAS